MELKYQSSESKLIGTRFYLTVFEHTPLIDTSLIPLETLENAFKHNITDSKIRMFYWDSKDLLVLRENSFNLKDLLSSCKEIQLFAEKYFPQFVI